MNTRATMMRKTMRRALLAAIVPAQLALAAAAGTPVATTLKDVLAGALLQDPQARMSEALRGVARERQSQARSRLGPSLTLDASRGEERDVELGRSFDRRVVSTDLSLRMNLYNGGADLKEWRASGHEARAAELDVQRAREEAGERIATAYLDLLRQQELRPLSERRLDAVRGLVALVWRQHELGKLSDADAAQAAAAQLDAEIAHGQLLAELAGARARLQVLAGVDVAQAVAPALDDAQAGTEADAAARPQSGVVLAADARADAALARVMSEASAWAPRVDFGYVKDVGSNTTPPLTTQRLRGWTLSARWEMPLMGERQSRVSESALRAQAAQADAERVLQQSQAELAALPQRIAQATRAVRQLDEQVGRYERLVDAGELLFQSGRRNLTQLVQVLDSLYATQQRRAEEAQRLRMAQLRWLTLRGRLLDALDLR